MAAANEKCDGESLEREVGRIVTVDKWGTEKNRKQSESWKGGGFAKGIDKILKE